MMNFDIWTRDPLWAITCYTGVQTETNPHGLVPAWNNEDLAEAWLRNQMELAVAHGARASLVNRMSGGTGLTHVTGASWFTMSERKRKIVHSLCRSFMGKLELVPFVGTSLIRKDLNEGWSPTNGAGVFLDPTSRVFHDSLETVAGWFGESGLVRRLILDNAAVPYKRSLYMALDRGWFCGEAIPHENGELDMKAINSMPWLATNTFINSVGRHWRFDRKTSRIYVWFTQPIDRLDPGGSYSRGRAIVNDFCARGYIPVAGDRDILDIGKYWAERSGRKSLVSRIVDLATRPTR